MGYIPPSPPLPYPPSERMTPPPSDEAWRWFHVATLAGGTALVFLAASGVEAAAFAAAYIPGALMHLRALPRPQSDPAPATRVGWR